jgi:hypothetical protein
MASNDSDNHEVFGVIRNWLDKNVAPPGRA